MAQYIVEGETLTDIADAIREKTETTDSIKTSDMATKILSISGSGSGSSPAFIDFDYSEDEKIIGSWIDGKPLYRKCALFTKTTAGTTTVNIKSLIGYDNEVDINIKLLDFRMENPTNNYSTLTYYFDGSDYFNYYIEKSKPNNLCIRSGSGWPKLPFTVCILFEYTKTIDEEHSFTPSMLNVVGASAAMTGYEYSTSEKVIGKWIDGKPVYRRVIVFDSSFSCASQWKSLEITIENINEIINAQVCDSEHNYGGTGIYVKNLSPLQIYAPAAISFTRLVIEYTKTTDAENSFTLDMLTANALPSTATDSDVQEVLS